jgi:hypothetical protein
LAHRARRRGIAMPFLSERLQWGNRLEDALARQRYGDLRALAQFRLQIESTAVQVD